MGLLNVYRAPDGYVLALRPEAVPCPSFAWLGCVSPDVFEAPLRDQIERDLQDAGVRDAQRRAILRRGSTTAGRTCNAGPQSPERVMQAMRC
jgi:hypothetical protein